MNTQPKKIYVDAIDPPLDLFCTKILWNYIHAEILAHTRILTLDLQNPSHLATDRIHKESG